MPRITEKLCAFVKYSIALGIVEILRGRLRGKPERIYNMSLNADFTIYPDLSFRKLVYYGVQSEI